MASLRGKNRSKKSDTRAKKRARARRVRIGAPDARLTPAAGVEALREVDRVLGVTAALDAGIGAVKERNRGLTGGELVVSMASAQPAGEDFLVGLDCRRADTAGQVLEPVPTPASTTAARIAKRFGEDQVQGIEKGVGTVNTTMVSLLPVVRRTSLLKVATIDGDATDVEVYGRTKEKAAHAYTGALTLRSHIGFWAEAGVPLAAELMGGTEDPRANAISWTARWPRFRPVWRRSRAAGMPATLPPTSPRRVWNAGSTSPSASSARRRSWLPPQGWAATPGHRPWAWKTPNWPSSTTCPAPGPGRGHHLHCPADPDPGRADPDRPGTETPHDRQKPARPGVGGPHR